MSVVAYGVLFALFCLHGVCGDNALFAVCRVLFVVCCLCLRACLMFGVLVLFVSSTTCPCFFCSLDVAWCLLCVFDVVR